MEYTVTETRKKNVLEAPFIRELAQICSQMYRLGWNERNGGNISLLLETGAAERYLDGGKPPGRINLGFDCRELAGRFFALTRTGSYFKNVESNPEHNLGIIRINSDGTGADVLWGFSAGGAPTSELPSHLLSHITRLRADSAHRVVMHCHATNTVAMTFVHPLDEKEFTRTLWRMITECIIVFPDGVGVLPWMLCGNDAIGKATAEKMKNFRVCVWAQHGVFAAGRCVDEAFGLIETVEKAADIYIRVMNGKILNTIRDGELRLLAETFGVDYRKDFLE
jgi:rhamnulose-1-phosphate aldolase